MRRATQMRFDGKTELAKAAPKRLADAWELLENPTHGPHDSDIARRHLCGACYLAEYAVECILKVYIIGALGAHRATSYVVKWSQVVDYHAGTKGLRGAGSHSLALLLSLTELPAKLDTDQRMRANWNTCSVWRHDWRYQAYNGMSQEEARSFVQACADVHDWVRLHLS